MKILPIFDYAAEQGNLSYLFTVRFDGEELDEYEKCYQSWTDITAVRAFLKENLRDLNRSFWQPKSIEDAVLEITEEADDFEADLLEIEERILAGEAPELVKSLFREPFYQYELAPVILKGKARGRQRPYLRLYGLHLEDEGQIIICGGGIKLTQKVNELESPHLLLEIQKAQRVNQFLKQQGIQFIEPE